MPDLVRILVRCEVCDPPLEVSLRPPYDEAFQESHLRYHRERGDLR